MLSLYTPVLSFVFVRHMCLSSYRLAFCVCWMNWFFWRTLLCVQKICFRMELSCASSDCWFKVMNRAGEVNRQSSVLYLISVIHHTTVWNRCLQLFHPENSLRIGKNSVPAFWIFFRENFLRKILSKWMEITKKYFTAFNFKCHESYTVYRFRIHCAFILLISYEGWQLTNSSLVKLQNLTCHFYPVTFFMMRLRRAYF